MEKPLQSVLINPPAALLGRSNAILTGRARRYRVPEFAGPFSIKSVVAGSAVWETAEDRFELDAGKYLLLNHGQRYSLTVQSNQPTETFCVFFERGFLEGIQRALTAPCARLLDDPFATLESAVGFFERLHPADLSVTPAIQRMHAAIHSGQATSESLEQQLLTLAEGLIRLNAGVHEEAARLGAIRTSTRTELLRRLHRGRRLIETSLDRRLRLPEIASEACLSPFHFHRAFTAVFGETPHDYLVRCRLERAKRLLADSDLPVSGICLEVGFQSPGSFSSLFRKRFGQSPRAFRSAKNSKI